MEQKIRIFLAGDSTVSSYDTTDAPITGWGQVLCEQFKGAEQCNPYHPEWTSFDRVMCYDLPELEIINCAKAGRSSRSFREEGRLEEIDQQIQEGDYLFVQFAHNDANKEKTERYVSVADYAKSLDEYRKICTKHHAIPVFVTAIVMRDLEHLVNGKIPVSFPEYRLEMIRYANENNFAVLDLGQATCDYLNTLEPEKSKQLYLWAEKGAYQGRYNMGVSDNTHLCEYGARKYASIVAELIKNNQNTTLNPLQMLLK